MTSKVRAFKVQLSKEERPYFIKALRTAGYDPMFYLEGHQVVAPAAHYAEVVDALAVEDGDMFDMSEEDDWVNPNSTAMQVSEMNDNIAIKFARAINRAGLEEEADKALEDMGVPNRELESMVQESFEVLDPDDMEGARSFIELYKRVAYRRLLKMYDLTADDLYDAIPEENRS